MVDRVESVVCPNCEIKMLYFQFVTSLLKFVKLERCEEIENPLLQAEGSSTVD